MAPGALGLVLRDVRPRLPARLPAVPPPLQLPVQFVLRGGRRALATPRPGAPLAPDRRRGLRLPPVGRRPDDEPAGIGRRPHSGRGLAEHRTGTEPRRAAPGAAAYRPQARLRTEPAPPRIRAG